MDVLVANVVAIPVVWALSLAISRPPRLNFSLLRRLVAGLVAFLAARPIIEAITPDAILRHVSSSTPFPLLWYLLLGVPLAVLLAMVLLVLGEAFVPSGSVPGPIGFARGLPGRFRRTRRYLRIALILLHRGLATYVLTRQRPDRGTAARRRLAPARLRPHRTARLDPAGRADPAAAGSRPGRSGGRLRRAAGGGGRAARPQRAGVTAGCRAFPGPGDRARSPRGRRGTRRPGAGARPARPGGAAVVLLAAPGGPAGPRCPRRCR
ncbi:MAG TPA: hypothetical protein VHW44_05945 [Pseudonocardiaceae bacterium]|nr:hypothetical protein [Pseudonocardiaceae bacterium]